MGAGAGMTTAMMAKPGSMSKNMQPMRWATGITRVEIRRVLGTAIAQFG
jgi:hypothetical protein